MQKKTSHALALGLAALLPLTVSQIFSGEPNPPQPNPNPPVVTPTVRPSNPLTVQATSGNPYAEIAPWLADFVNGDEAKRAEAEKKLLEKGGNAHRLLNGLTVNPDATIVKRAKELQAKIEAHGMELIKTAEQLQGKMQNEPLTTVNIEAARAAWAAAAAYVPQPAFRQQAQQSEQMMRMQANEVEASNKMLADCDTRLAAKPAPAGIVLAAIHLQRAQAYGGLQRFDDCFKSAQASIDATGKDGRYVPVALKMQVELSQRKQDHAAVESLCKKITADYPETLEAGFALGALAELYTERKRWDEAVAAVKNYMAAAPLDDTAQESAHTLLDKLTGAAHDYPRAYGLSSWLKTKLPVSRLKFDTLKTLADCSEYAVKDLAKAEAAYKLLAEQFADEEDVKPYNVDEALKRLKMKIDGKFPKEPAAADGTPEGALGKFLAAVRVRDGKTLATVVPTASAKEAVESLGDETSDLLPTVTFADFVVHIVKAEGDKADIELDYYKSTDSAPKKLIQKAIKENGAWKIQWQDPDTQLNPEAKKGENVLKIK